MANIKNILGTVAISAATTLGVVWGYGKYLKNQNTYGGQSKTEMPANYKYAGNTGDVVSGPGSTDFVAPAQAAIPTVVHIKTKTAAKQVTNNLPRSRQNNPFSDLFDDDILDQFFGGGRGVIPEQRASGSGVIISNDGYIVTNNHVVANADEITVTLSNKRTYTAKVLGTDPAYDLAVIKIEASGLPYLVYGNSDDVKIGQWVLAIGYPLYLETTVTAGIVSAKARTLGLNKDRSGKTQGGVESFIQTDAAVNQGNSGGALIDTDGKLIGINSAIASPTGTYAGYSYAIPVNIVKKVVDDLIKFGTVQRGYLGINFVDASDASVEQKKRDGIPETAYGIYVTDVPKDGAAFKAGIKQGDQITSINNIAIGSTAELQEQVSRYKPGDKITVGFVRSNQPMTADVTLKNKAGNFDVVQPQSKMDLLGADFGNLDKKQATQFGISGGVVVKKIGDGAINEQTRMKDNFVITQINGKAVTSTDDLRSALATGTDFTLTGIYPGYEGMYDYRISLR